MCGGSLTPAKQRKLALPISDLLLVAVVLVIAFLWWTRSTATVEEDGSGRANPTAAVAAPGGRPGDIPASGFTPTATLAATAEITGSAALTDATPTATPTPVVYTVVSGDTVEKISAAFGIAVQDLMAANGLTSDLIRVDQKLTIPTGPVELGADGKPVPTTTSTPKSAIYLVVVSAGDTIDLIAKRLGSSVEAIVRANPRLESADTIIRPGEQLVVPVGTVTGTLALPLSQPPTATLVPTPTPTPGPRWPAPRALSPQAEQLFEGGDVLLQWLSVGALDADEVYFVRVKPDAPTEEEWVQVTSATSVRVPEEWLKRLSRRTDRFIWSVQVARDARSPGAQTAMFAAVGPPSASRAFIWQGAGN